MTGTDKRAQIEEEELAPREKAAILMVALGEDAAGEIYLLPLVANPATERDPAGSILQLVAE